MNDELKRLSMEVVIIWRKSYHEDVRGKWMYSSTSFDRDSRCRLVVSFAHRPLYPGEKALVTHLVRGWVGTSAGLEAVGKRRVSFPCQESKPVRPVRSPSLYRQTDRHGEANKSDIATVYIVTEPERGQDY
jgi:hypothetical protein